MYFQAAQHFSLLSADQGLVLRGQVAACGPSFHLAAQGPAHPWHAMPAMCVAGIRKPDPCPVKHHRTVVGVVTIKN